MQPKSLVAHIYKAKFYPHGEVLTATISHHPSFIWRSLCESQTLVQQGHRRCIGDGRDIVISGEPWLKGDANLYLETPLVTLFESMRVCDMFLPDT
ncbi:hypothetical protein LINGRAHAP2_LOCUS14847 [Linum grandiflorum]